MSVRSFLQRLFGTGFVIAFIAVLAFLYKMRRRSLILLVAMSGITVMAVAIMSGSLLMCATFL